MVQREIKIFFSQFLYPRILASLKATIHIHPWPPSVLKAVEGSF